MFSFAANMYTAMYMRLINQRNRTLERQAFYHMNIGYQKALSFMNDDGSFSLSRSGYLYWGKEKVPLPPSKTENQKQFSLPRLPYKYDSSNIETTAYALMVYNARKEILLENIVKWLNAQRLTDGGWASTQVPRKQ
ncbi:unnamed protein product [Nesidiocoris tenuis]|uniref:Alpha-macroglobulin-like TED domain-containing protein n=1 Tax=Nesidiocoris tenuis TaxID=355587 RepID=A0A6H5FZI2_9HEMI|nr:unnamed protein product [Nesidiocoris tenuis]